MAKRRLKLLMLGVLMLAGVVATLSATAVNLATSTEASWPHWLGPIRRYPWQLITASIPVAGLLAYAIWRLQEVAGKPPGRPPPRSFTPLPDWIIGRAVELDQAVQALRRRGRAVGITTALQGAGGFGKTTLAKMVCADPRVSRRYRNRIYHITVGRDARGRTAVTEKVNELIGLLTGERGTFSDPQAAGQHLGWLFDQQPRMLLVIDDIWEAEQLEPFLIGGRWCSRRGPEVGLCFLINVDQALLVV